MNQRDHRQPPEITLPVAFLQELFNLIIDKNNYRQVRSLINTNKLSDRDKNTLGSILYNIITLEEFISKELSFIIDYDRLLTDITISRGIYLHSYENTIIKEEDLLQIISYGYTCIQKQETTYANYTTTKLQYLQTFGKSMGDLDQIPYLENL
jgi:hypothetical protein